jgi:hypothetical protein
MQKVTAAQAVKKSISVLERRQKEEGKLLMQQFTITFESLKPLNVLRKIISDISEPSELKENLIQTTAGLVTGYISRKLLVRSSKNPFLRMAGVYLQYAVTNFVSKHSDSIKALGAYYIDKLSKKYRYEQN